MNSSSSGKSTVRAPADGDVATASRDLYADLHLTIETISISQIKGYARNRS